MRKQCKVCERWFDEDGEMYGYWCRECALECVDIELGMKYLSDQSCEVEFYIEWYFNTGCSGASAELIELCKTVFKCGGDHALRELRAYINEDLYNWIDYLDKEEK